MTKIKDPKQVASTIRQILFILITSSSAGFMALSWPRGPGRPGGASGAQKRVPRRGEPAPGRFRTELAELRSWIPFASPRLSEPPVRVSGRRGCKARELLCKCGDAWPRPRAPAGPPRLCSMLRRLGSAGACGRRCLLAGRATGMREGRCHRRRALASVTVQAPLPPSLAKSYFIALQ